MKVKIVTLLKLVLVWEMLEEQDSKAKIYR